MPTRRLHYGILMIALAIGCDEATSPPTRLLAPLPRRTEEVAAPAPAPVWAQRVEGTDEGAKYVLLFPTAPWNGRLVLFVHGLVDPARPIALPSTGGFDPFGRSNYAVALSSFSENGWAVKDGAQRTHALRDIFTKQFGPPSRVYLYGQSMGSLIALKLAESFPTQYDGVFAECGILGGTLA